VPVHVDVRVGGGVRDRGSAADVAPHDLEVRHEGDGAAHADAELEDTGVRPPIVQGDIGAVIVREVEELVAGGGENAQRRDVDDAGRVWGFGAFGDDHMLPELRVGGRVCSAHVEQ
jgi:hypothetical protein